MAAGPDTSSAHASVSATPAMRQYLDTKAQHRDAILFFRMGDFYEMFYEDALVAARALELTLTTRSRDAGGASIPMCGVPFHAADTYIGRLVKKGFRVAVCDQVEDPRKAKGLVRREVVRVVSPGTLTDSTYLDAREPAFIMSLAPGRGKAAASIGVALIDLSTGEFTVAEYAGPEGRQALADEMAVLKPREIIAPADLDLHTILPSLAEGGVPATAVEPWAFDLEAARRTLLDQVHAAGLQGFDLEGREQAVAAAGALVHYLAYHPEGRSRPTCGACAFVSGPTRFSSIRPRSSTSKSSKGSKAGATDRSSAKSIARSRPSAPEPCGPGCCARWSRSNRFAIASTPSRSSPFGPPSVAAFARPSTPSRTWSGSSPARRSAPRVRATSSA